METLKAIQKEAFAAWQAKPNSQTEAALASATKAVAAAKAAAAAPAVDKAALNAAISAAQAAVALRGDAAAQRLAVQAADRRRQVAMDWPRCGEGYPATAEERADVALISKFGDEKVWEDAV